MQKETTGLRTTDKNYVTIVKQACNKVKGFEQLYKEMERAICITGKSKSTLTNYSRHLEHLALHYNCFPLELDAEQVMDYLPDKKPWHHFCYFFQIHGVWNAICLQIAGIGIQTIFSS